MKVETKQHRGENIDFLMNLGKPLLFSVCGYYDTGSCLDQTGKHFCQTWLCCCLVTEFVRLFATPWAAAHQASLSCTNSQSLLKLMSIESVMPSNHLILCRSLLLLPSIFPSIRLFSDESILHIRWPNCWSFSFSISPSSEYSGLISFGILITNY